MYKNPWGILLMKFYLEIINCVFYIITLIQPTVSDHIRYYSTLSLLDAWIRIILNKHYY